MLIKDSLSRYARHQEKQTAVLRFLAREGYSDFKTINRLFNFKNHRVLYSLLNKLVSNGMLEKHALSFISLWSITRKGKLKIDEDEKKIFRKIKLEESDKWKVLHCLQVQNTRLSFEISGTTDWVDGKNAPFPTQLKHRPDAVLTRYDGKPIALEVETRLKTPARYKEIMKNHLLAKKAGDWFYVYFVCANDQQKIAIKCIIKSVNTLYFKSKKYILTQEDEAIFQYITVQELQDLAEKKIHSGATV